MDKLHRLQEALVLYINTGFQENDVLDLKFYPNANPLKIPDEAYGSVTVTVGADSRPNRGTSSSVVTFRTYGPLNKTDDAENVKNWTNGIEYLMLTKSVWEPALNKTEDPDLRPVKELFIYMITTSNYTETLPNTTGRTVLNSQSFAVLWQPADP